MNIASLLLSLSFITSTASTAAPRAKPDPAGCPLDGPNIILVLLDAARADHFSCYGYPRTTTPRIDAIARRGTKFLRHFSGFSWTSDSIPRLLSSRYISRRIFEISMQWGIPDVNNEFRLDHFDARQRFLPQILSRCGYQTALFSQHPRMLPPNELARQMNTVHVDLERSGASTELLVQKAADWYQRATKKGKAFLYVHLLFPHEPYQVDLDQTFSRAVASSKVAEVLDKRQNNHAKDKWASGWTDEEIGVLARLYDDNLHYADRWVGALDDAVARQGLADRTILLITGDHGEHLGRHGRLQHGGPPYASVTHVPWILVYPGHVPAGGAVESVTEAVDVLPTLLDLAGIRPPDASFDGVTLRPFLSDNTLRKELVLTETSIRTSSHSFYTEPRDLFDLRADPDEMMDVGDRLPWVRVQMELLHEKRLRPYRQRFLASKVLSASAAFLPVRELEPHLEQVLMKPDTPLHLRASPPNGRYHVDVLVRRHDSPLDQRWRSLRFRFRAGGRFRLVEKTESVHEEGKALEPDEALYLHLGETVVQQSLLDVELQDSTGGYAVLGLRLVPHGTKIPAPHEDINGKERLDAMRRLGYID